MNGLKRLLQGFEPAQQKTAAPQVSKVVSRPVRDPINRQTALLMRPNTCWLSQPLPDKPKAIDQKELARAMADLKIERNAHAQTRADLGNTRAEVRRLRLAVAARDERIAMLSAQLSGRDDIIRQLEDLKL